jgi:hypothetical protein
MNAYELAKDGMEVHSSMPDSPEYLICKAFIEQADELKQWKLLHNDCMEMIEQRDARIKELEKQAKEQYGLGYKEAEDDMKTKQSFFEKQSEPVAELLVNDGEPWGCRYDDNITLAGVDGWIPLYTTPQTKDKE